MNKNFIFIKKMLFFSSIQTHPNQFLRKSIQISTSIEIKVDEQSAIWRIKIFKKGHIKFAL
ncbi:unnamed protein product [Paramecium octaurelia]|uniref:Uncharacterized protein n=1 Tax=Paramecium octaurelia TaxID=43137 RepID=A0A8S1Y7A4_PAROT|nr:unnamed protein product [Paramecium octaurelia]